MNYAISLRQPWAWLVVNGIKTIENRNWSTKHRGNIYIHAAQKFDMDAYDWLKGKFVNDPRMPTPVPLDASGFYSMLPKDFHKGGIVGQAQLVDCVTESHSPWFFGKFGFVLENACELPFQPLRGQLGIFKVDRLESE